MPRFGGLPGRGDQALGHRSGGAPAEPGHVRHTSHLGRAAGQRRDVLSGARGAPAPPGRAARLPPAQGAVGTPPPRRRSLAQPRAARLRRRAGPLVGRGHRLRADVGGLLYRAVAPHVHNRRIGGWAVAEHRRSGLAIEAVDMAVWRRPRMPSFIIPTKGAGTPALPWGGGCEKSGSWARWGAAAIASTTPPRRAPSPRSNASCSPATASRRGARPDSPCWTTSRGSPTRTGGTLRSGPCLPLRARGGGPLAPRSPSNALSTKPG